MGDFNDVRCQDEKKGTHSQPEWLCKGFDDVITRSGLRDIEFSGCQFTWERSRGSLQWVREKLDRILASDSWIDMFEGVKATLVEALVSDHLPLVLWPNVDFNARSRRRFKFENLWLKERRCRDLVANCWDNTRVLQLLELGKILLQFST